MTKSRGIRGVPSKIRIDGNVAYVELSRGFEAIIDLADIDLIASRKWYTSRSASGYAYAFTSGKPNPVAMHRVICKPKPDEIVDHKNGNPLDNRRDNLRVASHAENMRNRKLDARNKFGLKGVSQKGSEFSSCIQHEGKSISLGSYSTPEEAAAAYRGAAKALWGEFHRD